MSDYDGDDREETPEEMEQAADGALILAEMAIERGVTRLADLGNLPPLTPEMRAKYLARARAREARRQASQRRTHGAA